MITMTVIYARDRTDRIGNILFNRFGFRIRSADIAKIINVSASTAARKRRDPENMTLGEAIDIANATDLSDEAWVSLRGNRG